MIDLGYQQLLGITPNQESSPQLRAQVRSAQACRDFESLFIEQMFKEMRKTLQGKSDATISAPASGDNFYHDMLYQSYATDLANRSSLGLGESLYQQTIDLQQAVNRYQNDGSSPPSTQNLS